MKINGNLVFDVNGTGEIQNVFIERLATLPTFDANQKGRIAFNTTDSLYYYNNGSVWTPLATGGNAAALQAEVDRIEASLGASVNGDGSFNAAAFAGATYISNPASLTAAILDLDSAITGHDNLSELLDVSVSGVTDKEFLQYNATAGKWEAATTGSASGVQAQDAGLDSFAALTGPGFVTVDSSGNVVSARSFAVDAGLTLTHGDGSGNVQIGLEKNLAALQGVTSTGILVRTGTDTIATRDIVAGTTGSIVITDGGGVAGNVSLDLQTLTIPTNVGSFLKFDYDTYGRVTGVNAVTASDITGLVDSIYVNVAGDTMTGNLNMGNTYTVTGLASPATATDAATKGYVDSLVTGISWKEPVDGTGTALPGTAAAGFRFLNTTDGKIYTATAANTFDAGVAPADGWAVFDRTDETGYVYSGSAWVQFTGTGMITAGVGLDKTGNVLSVKLGAGIANLPSGEVGVDLFSASAGAIILTTDGSTRSTGTDAQLALLLAGSTLTQDASGLKIAAGGVTEVEINSSALAANGGLTGGSGSKLAVNVDGVTLTIGSNVVSVKDGGISTAKIADGAVTNVKLANSSIAVAGDTGTGITATLGGSVSVVGSNGISVDATGTTATVALTASLSNLSDATVTTPAAGQTLVYNGTKFVNKPIYFAYTSTGAATSHTVTHSIGQKYCNVTVVDSTDNVVIPESIQFNSASELVVTFTSPINCTVVVMGVAGGATN